MTRYRALRRLAAALGLLALTATAAQADDRPGNTHECFWTRNANGFAAQDDRTLNVRVNSRDVFQFEMMGPCPDMAWDQQIALVSRGSSNICTGMDAEVVTRSPAGRMRCPVRSVRKLTPDEIAALPRKARP